MRVPGATYRLQLHGGFTMEDAAGIVDYLGGLGVSHLYLSPVLRSAAGSTHGYDTVDPTEIDPARGGEAGLHALRRACEGAGLGIVADIVPNHLAASSSENAWWRSVLALGERSPWARVFDVRWHASASGDEPRVTLPILGKTLEGCLGEGEIRLERRGGWVELVYYEHGLPVRPETVAALAGGEAVGSALGDAVGGGADLGELSRALTRLIEENPGVGEAIDRRVAEVNGDWAALAAVVERQHFLPVLWRLEHRRLNYRRFFDINEMVGVRMEDPRVFDAVHGTVLREMEAGVIDGLRVDHPDGLRDPRGYFERLHDATGGAWVVAEKILEGDERLPGDWRVAGTTGYEFLNDVLGVLIDGAAEDAMTGLYAEFARAEANFEIVAHDAKVEAARTLLAADLGRLVELVGEAAEADAGLACDRSGVSESLVMLAACFGVYRTYIVPEEGRVGEGDRAAIEHAAEGARRLRPDLSPEPLDAVVDVLLLRSPALADGGRAGEAAREFVAAFQQYTAPVVAKGVEDTAFYRHLRFVALNEVGGDPGRFGIDAEAFHARCVDRAEHWPAAMITTATHDTKRGEDVRARLAAISEMPGAWADEVRRWARDNAQRFPETAPLVDEATEYLLYQTLVGAWPIDAERAVAYMLKAVREAKVNTAWRQQNEHYEGNLDVFTRAALADADFTRDVGRFVDRLLVPGRVNGITQALLRLSCPGVPDTYQGCELWELSLVDPDNRRPVDFGLRRRLLERARRSEPRDIWATLADADDPGLAKLFTVASALRARRVAPGAFGVGSGYEPLAVVGERSGNVVAFARNDRGAGPRVCVVVQRAVSALGAWGEGAERWGDTAVRLPAAASGGGWVNALADRSEVFHAGAARAAALFGVAPAALLIEQEASAEG